MILSADFNREEFACKGLGCCRNSAPVMTELIEALQALRTLIGKPVEIVSGFRCRTHNAVVGGAKDSQHCHATAADIRVKRMTSEELAEYAEKIPAFDNGGIGVYASWVHVDCRHGKARWHG